MEEKKKMGRPTIYSDELAQEICSTIACQSRGLTYLCSKNPHWPERTTIFQWRLDKPDFSNLYDKAKYAQAESLADEMLDIADETSSDKVVNNAGNEVCNSEYVNRSRLRVDTRKWILERLSPKKYGSKLENSRSEDEKSLIEKLIDKL